MKKKYCILIPSLVPTGPVKGAIAFANAIAGKRSVKLVSLKTSSDWVPPVDERIEMICLEAKHSGWFEKRKAYCDLLSKEGGREKVLSLSMCFSADMLNLICRKHAEIFSSIRGNLPMNYRMEFGFLGFFLAYVHLASLKSFDYVSVMSQSMAKQVFPLLSVKPLIVGNFIDEKALDQYRGNYVCNEKFKFIFVGSLTERKQPLLLVESMCALRKEGYDVRLDIVGSGPLEAVIKDLISRYDLDLAVKLHGQIDCPYDLISRADVFVLPSLSEGISRAALEALHLGLPCILRQVDGNEEIVQSGMNGQLFKDNENLIYIMRKLIRESHRGTESLLPAGFRQKDESAKILARVEKERA